MTRAVVAAAVAACVVAAGGNAANPALEVEASAPRTAGFGDVFELVVVATVPTSEAETAELTADVRPFTVLDAEPIEREQNGDVTVIRLVRRLACLEDGCVGRGRSLRVVLPAPVLRSESGSLTGTETPITVRGRIATSPALSGPPELGFGPPDPNRFRADTTIPPASGPSPATIVTALTVTAVALFLAALLLLVTAVRRRAAPADDPLARAIRLVRESAGRPVADRRRAADLLAQIAGDRDRELLAADATRIAWAAPPPTAGTVEELATSAARETA